MDNLTHTLFAATLARTPLGRAGRGSTTVLLLGSNAPDIDVVSLIGGGLGYLDWHLGPTHGPLGVLGLGAATGGLVWLAARWRDGRRPAAERLPPAPLPTLILIGMVAVGLHIAMDLPTSYGTRVLSPFHDHWYTTDWMPIVDVYLLALLAAGLAIGRLPGARPFLVLTVVVLMAANYGLRATTHSLALAAAPQAFGPRLPPACGASGLSVVSGWDTQPRRPFIDADGERCLAELAAIPTFLSPFRWQIIARTRHAYEVRTVDLLGDAGSEPRPWRLSRRVPDRWTPAVMRAAESDVGRRFLSFSRYPAAHSVLEADGSTTVRWTDLRFAPTPATPRASPNRRNLFSATVRVGADGAILEQRLGP